MLKVKIYSFSYKKSGIPRDNTSNGGGFVFDCRFIDNPGRKDEFKALNGKDKEVVEFLDKNKKMSVLLHNAEEIIKNSVDNYLSREFTDLMVSFGCTGGQHRSVYAAEKLKMFLEHTYNGKITIDIRHIDIPIG